MPVFSIDITKTQNKIYSGYLHLGGESPQGERISLTNYYLERDGKPWIPVMGEFHFSRFPCRYWEEEILKVKAGGVEIIATYVFWNHHEEEEGVFNWTDDRDLRRFTELCRKHGMYLLVRMGPFCHGEARNGGIPDWLYARPFQLRSNDEGYLFYVKRLYTEISTQLAGLLYKDGGPVIGVQLENEFMHSGAPWEVTFNKGTEWVTSGSGGKEHMRTLKKLALDAGIDVPLYTCTAWGSPVVEDEFLPMYGGYAFYAWEDDPDSQKPSPNYVFTDLHQGGEPYDKSRIPFACCEMGSGMLVYYKNRPVVPPESVEAMTVTKLASGSNLPGYYMYHGGSNPVGKHGFLNEHKCPRISYDYQAPIREFGQLSGSYKRLKRLFLFLHEFSGMLAPMASVLPEDASKIAPENASDLRWAVRTDGNSGFLFLNNYQDHVDMKPHKDIFFDISTGRGRIRFPRENGLTLREGVSAVLPFNLSMEGALLKYSTAQLLTCLKAEGAACYFFFAPEGISPELAFEDAGIEDIRASRGVISHEGGCHIASVVPGIDSTISFTTASGIRTVITVLTHEESLDFWKGTVCGKEMVVVSGAGLVFKENRITLTRKGGTEADILVCPYEGINISARGGELTRSGNTGVFGRYGLRFDDKPVMTEVEKKSADNAVIHLGRDIPEGVNDIFLEILYNGDIGEAYLDGKLINDNFYNGRTWEIGLKRFLPDVIESGLFIHVTPAVKPDGGAKVEYTDMAALVVADPGEGIAEIQSIRAFPEYSAEIYVKV